jgi:flagellar hook protein FlgE
MMRAAGSDTDYIEMTRPSFGVIQDTYLATGVAATGTYAPVTAPTSIGDSYSIDGKTYTTTAPLTAAETMSWLVLSINNDSTQDYTAALDGTGNLVLTHKNKVLQAAAPTVTGTGLGALIGPFNLGADPLFVPVTGPDMGDGTTPPSATASGPSRSLGFSSTSFALRGGTAGGPQTVADMTNIFIAPNGIITGLDAQGLEVTIGRIDLATFANPPGLNQAGSTTYTVSANSGPAILVQPGMNGSGKLVTGTLELSNVDLSREFSDMITTQRGYQANSRIITVSDTMLEELINLKR